MDSTERMRLFREAKVKMEQIHQKLAEHVGYSCETHDKIDISPTVRVASDHSELSFEILFNFVFKGIGHQEFEPGRRFRKGFVYDWLNPIGCITVKHIVETNEWCVKYKEMNRDYPGFDIVDDKDYLQQMNWLYTCANKFYDRLKKQFKKLQLTQTPR
jgi:hypothetical protein